MDGLRNTDETLTAAPRPKKHNQWLTTDPSSYWSFRVESNAEQETAHQQQWRHLERQKDYYNAGDAN